MTDSRAQNVDERDRSAGNVESPKVAAQTGGWVGRETAGRTPAADHDHSGAGVEDRDAVVGAPGDREFHLRRVTARFPRRLSARRLAMLAEILSEDAPGDP